MGTTSEAMKELENKHTTLLAWGRHIAVTFCRKNGTTHSKMVFDELIKRGLADPNKKAFYMGAIFNKLEKDGVIEWTKHYYKYSDPERNVHDREIKLWRLKDDSKPNDYDREPTTVA